MPPQNQPPAPSPSGPAPEGHKMDWRPVIGATIVIVVIAIGYLWYLQYKSMEGDNLINPAPATQQNKVPTAVNTHPTSLPPGFPEGLPIEMASLTESTKVSDPAHHNTLYTAGFTSTKSRSTVWSDFSSYFTKNGYTLSSASKSPSFINASKDGDLFTINISTVPKGTWVQISYLDKQ